MSLIVLSNALSLITLPFLFDEKIFLRSLIALSLILLSFSFFNLKRFLMSLIMLTSAIFLPIFFFIGFISFFIIIGSAFATYAKSDDVMRNKCDVLFLIKCIYVPFNYAMNIYMFVNTLFILHLRRKLSSSIAKQ